MISRRTAHRGSCAEAASGREDAVGVVGAELLPQAGNVRQQIALALRRPGRCDQGRRQVL